MQRRKIVILCLSLLLASLTVSGLNISRAHAFLATTPTVTLTGLTVHGFSDPLTGTKVDAIAAGATLTVNAYITASTGASAQYQRNVTIGFKGDWMNSYQNATSASPTSTLSLTAGQTATVSIAVVMPSTGGTVAHSWFVSIWDGSANSLNPATCGFASNGEKTPPQCWTISFDTAFYNQLAIYTGDQLSAAQANVQEENAITAVQAQLTAIVGGSVHQNPAGSTAAAGQLAQANNEDSLGDQAWQNGDYSGAKTHYQNALNDANAAAASLTGQGGGQDNANLVNVLLGGVGIALIGIGALFAGLGSMFYLRKKSKA
jgi:hypothetical protein